MSHFNMYEETINVSHYKSRDMNYSFMVVNGEAKYQSGIVPSRKLTLLKQEGDVVLIKANGFSGWCGRGTTRYYSPHYIIGTVNPNSSKVSTIYEVEYTRAFTRKAKTIAEALFLNMIRGEEPEITKEGEFV